MKKYSIILPNERAKTYEYVTLFILGMNLFLFGSVYLSALDIKIKNLGLAGTVVCTFSFLMMLIQRFTRASYFFRFEIIFLILSLFWFLADRDLIALCIFCFAVMGTYSRRIFEVVFTKDGIVYPSFPRKIFQWKDVSNVVLKDGILTIDLKNNKLIQAAISKESTGINEREFNLFCKEQLDQFEK